MIIKTQFTKQSPMALELSDELHPLFDATPPLSPQQMLRRTINGQPISVYKPEERLKFNNHFFKGDKFDVMDTVKSFNDRMKQRRQEAFEKEKSLKQEFEEFKRAKANGTVDSLSSTVLTDTKTNN